MGGYAASEKADFGFYPNYSFEIGDIIEPVFILLAVK